ncbi:hypothetical protein YC2023_091377 [Brassica napus]
MSKLLRERLEKILKSSYFIISNHRDFTKRKELTGYVICELYHEMKGMSLVPKHTNRGDADEDVLSERRKADDAFECSRQTVERGRCVVKPVFRMLETSLSSKGDLEKLKELMSKLFTAS